MAGTEVIVLPAVHAEAPLLAERLRPVEADEVRAATGREPLAVIKESIAISDEAWSVYFDGQLACIWGVARYGHRTTLGGRVGIAWLLTTRLVEQKAKAFWKLCLDLVPWIFERWDEIINAIDARHAQALRWAKRLGFRLEEPAPFGAMGLPFCRFSATRSDLNV